MFAGSHRVSQCEARGSYAGLSCPSGIRLMTLAIVASTTCGRLVYLRGTSHERQQSAEPQMEGHVTAKCSHRQNLGLVFILVTTVCSDVVLASKSHQARLGL